MDLNTNYTFISMNVVKARAKYKLCGAGGMGLTIVQQQLSGFFVIGFFVRGLLLSGVYFCPGITFVQG